MSKMSIATEELTRIYNRDGSVKPTILVQESRPKTAPLHGRFEWNDKVAGEEHRKLQARKIIRSNSVIVEGGEDDLIHIPTVVADGEKDNEGEYKPATVVVESQGEFERYLSEMLGKVHSMQASMKKVEVIAFGEGANIEHATIVLRSLAVVEDSLKLMLKPS